MKNILISIKLTIFLLVSVSMHVDAQKLIYLANDSMKYKITIINYYFGRVDNRTIVTSDSLSYETDVH